MEPYFDPLNDPLGSPDELFDRFADPAFGMHPDPDSFMDPLGRILGQLEDSIEGTSLPPPFEPEPIVLPPETFGPTSIGPASQGPPPPPESNEKPWIALQAPSPAKPYFTPEGLSLPSYSPGRGGGIGLRHSDDSSVTRWCAQDTELVTEEICQDCDQWKDHGAGFEQCYHDWLEENGDNRNDSNKVEKE